jgi:hypothetical protein
MLCGGLLTATLGRPQVSIHGGRETFGQERGQVGRPAHNEAIWTAESARHARQVNIK